MLGTHCVKTWSSTQAIIATSSGEAEYYGVVKAASVGLGVRSLLADLGVTHDLEVLTDATAAKGLASKKGLGSTRHIEVHYLWVQERVHRGDLTLSKVWGHDNPADLLTKHLDSKTMNRYMSMFGMKYLDGRSASIPSLASVAHNVSFSIASLSAGLRPKPKKAKHNHARNMHTDRQLGLRKPAQLHQLLRRNEHFPQTHVNPHFG